MLGAMRREDHEGTEVHEFKTAKSFESWLKKNLSRTEAIWIRFAKKSSKKKSPTYEEAREVAIRYGWIDGLKNAFDEDWYLLRFSPRRRRSKWSQINRDIAEKLIADGLMEPSGMKQVEAAKADGRWAAAYASQSKMTLPAWFKKELQAKPKAYAYFQTLPKSQQFGVAYQLRDAKKEETKRRRADKFLAKLKAGERPV